MAGGSDLGFSNVLKNPDCGTLVPAQTGGKAYSFHMAGLFHNAPCPSSACNGPECAACPWLESHERNGLVLDKDNRSCRDSRTSRHVRFLPGPGVFRSRNSTAQPPGRPVVSLTTSRGLVIMSFSGFSPPSMARERCSMAALAIVSKGRRTVVRVG